jgi:hypothetical protein
VLGGIDAVDELLGRAEGIEETVVVAFDYSCIVCLELLARRIERQRAGEDPGTRISFCLLANGGLSRRDGVRALPATAGFVDEHREHAERWDLARIAAELQGSASFHLVGSAEDRFEGRQFRLARERLGGGVQITELPGGHLATAEQPDRLADLIAGRA